MLFILRYARLYFKSYFFFLQIIFYKLQEGGDHLISKMFARLYMLHSLQIVLENALDILGITPVSRM